MDSHSSLYSNTSRTKSQQLSLRESTPPTTPTALSISAHQLFSDIRAIHDELVNIPDLAPSTGVNALLTRLVTLCVESYSPEFISYFNDIQDVEALCDSLRPLCAAAEGELERHWADRILKTPQHMPGLAEETRKSLHLFPYYENYLDLSRLEASLLSAFLPLSSSPANIAFIGSGPLPFTSFCLLDLLPTCKIHNIDRDGSALYISKQLTQTLGYDLRMTFSCEDVSVNSGNTTNWQNFDVIFLAALVGMNSAQKIDILASLARKLRSGTLVIARSARGLRSVLYPVLELSDDLLSIGCEVLLEVHPWTSVVNSVIVLKVK